MEVLPLLFTGLSTLVAVVCAVIATRAHTLARKRFSSAKITRDLAQLQIELIDQRDLIDNLLKKMRSISQRQTMRERREKETDPEPEKPSATPLEAVPAECPDPEVDPAGFKRWHRLHTLRRS